MQSKKSSSKGALLSATLLKKNLSRFWPLWGGASLAGCVLPLYLLLNLLSPYYYSNRHATPSMMAQSLYGVFCYAVPIISLLYAILCAMVVWSYLYNARSVGLMHSLPVDRRCLFLTNTLSGLAMMLLPYVIVGSFTVLICIGFNILPPLAVLKVAVGIMGLSIFYFATATLCAHLTSHIFALPVFYFIGHFFAVGFHALISNFAANFIFGYVGGSAPDWVQFFSPTVFLTNGVLNMGYIPPESLDAEGTYVLNGMWAVGVYTLIGIALLAAAFLLYRLRHSESAGEVVAYRALKPIFRYGVALASALTLGQLLYEILWRMPFQTGAYAQMLPMGVCMVIAAILGYYIASMLLKKSLRVFRGDWQGPVTVAALIVILCGCVPFDLFGIASAVPAEGDIREVSVSLNYSSGDLTLWEGDPLMADALALHEAIIQNQDAIRADSDALRDAVYGPYDETADRQGLRLRFAYNLQSGRTFYREYYLAMSREDWETAGTYANAVNTFFNSPDTQAAMYSLPEGGTITMGYADFYNMVADTQEAYWEDYYGELDQAQAEAVYEAVLQDAREGNIKETDPFDPAEVLGNLTFDYTISRRPQTGDSDGYSNSIYGLNLNVYETMEHTIQALEDVGAFPTGSGNPELMPLPDPEAYEVVPLPSTEQA